MSEFIPLSVPNFCGNERKYVDEALEGAWVSTSGAKVGEMEECIAKYVGMPQAVCCASGSAALHLAALTAAESTAEKAAEDVAQVAKVEAAAVSAAPGSRAVVRIHPGEAELVVPGFFLGIGQDLIGLVDLLELLLGFFITGVHVRVVFPGQLFICFFDFIL